MAAVTAGRATAAPRTSVLLASQAIFNIGFYAVVPFLAITMRDDFALAGAAIGLVLGARTFSQQGLFLLGGILRDHYGARTLIVAGCAVRVAGYVALAFAGGLPGFLFGAVLTGMGGALFSPALESLVGEANAKARNWRLSKRPSLFARLVLVGELGAAIGPLLGALLLGFGFAATVLTGAALFASVGFILWFLVPTETAEIREARPATTDRWDSLRNRRFLVFAALFSINLLAYNQLYLGLSFEVDRIHAGTSALGSLFLLVSLLTIVLQWPAALWARRLGAARAFSVGFAVMATGFMILAVSTTIPSMPGFELLPATAMIACLAVGHMLVAPVALELVPRFASRAPLGAYYGLLATCGGVSVLIGSLVLGPLFAGAWFAPAWGILAALTAAAAVALPRFLPIHSTTTPTERQHAL